MKRLTNKQLEVMEVLWDADEPLKASDIVDRNKNININTAQAALKTLLKLNYIKVADIFYSGTVLCRCFAPAIEEREYLNSVLSSKPRGLSVISALISENADEAMLDELQKMIDDKRAAIKTADK